MPEKKRIELPPRRIKIELDVKLPYSTDFPKDFKRETLEDQMDRWFRKRMREGGQR